MASLILDGNLEALRAIVGDPKRDIPPDPNASPLKIWFATVVLKGIAKGDMSSLSLCLDRTVGKVKDKIELSGNDGGPIELSSLPKDKLDELLKSLVSEAAAHGIKPD